MNHRTAMRKKPGRIARRRRRSFGWRICKTVPGEVNHPHRILGIVTYERIVLNR